MKPILFSTEMVRAILDNRNTQTRRVIKPQPPDDWEPCISDEKYKPKYQVGDILWVQETWQFERLDLEREHTIVFRDGEEITFIFNDEERREKWFKYIFKSGWQSPYFMPKEAARIFLKVTDIRVERLQDISESDAIKEGVKMTQDERLDFSYKEGFSFLWDFINAKRERGIYVWERNPWVFVYDFGMTMLKTDDFV